MPLSICSVPKRRSVPSIALIGSFRKHYQQILDARSALQKAGILVTTPRGNPVIDEGQLFVRFAGEFEGDDDATVQCYTLHRILSADAVYVVVPGGYIGRTTCYEVGRIVQAGRPVYFSESPQDLPLHVPMTFVVQVDKLVKLVLGKEEGLSTLHAEGEGQCHQLERQLLRGEYVLGQE